MKLSIRGSDIRLASPLWPLCWALPSTVISNGATYQKLVASVPEGFFWAGVGFAVASYIWDPFQKDSRLRQLWRWLTDVFEVEHLAANTSWSDWNEPGDHMPMTDIGVRLRLKFRRNVKGADLRLRIYSCTGQANPSLPFDHLIKLGRFDMVKGEIMTIPLVDLGVAEAGWDHTRQRGWGPEKTNFVGGSRNVAIIECQHGRLTQRHKIFVAMVVHTGKHTAPRIYVQDEEDDVFDTSKTARTGMCRYDA